MSGSVAVPTWLFVVLITFALWVVLERLILPGARWYFRRKVDLVVEEINTRFAIQLPQFKLTRREVLIDRLVDDPKVQTAVECYCRENSVAREVALERVTRFAREIVPAFNAYAYFRLGYWLAKRVAQSLYRVRIGYNDAATLAAVRPNSTVVFVMNHRSNMDYVLVAFLAAEKVALSYAVGEWARIWPLQSLIRAMGAYFVRRESGNALYRMVLQRYVQMATAAGVPQAIFPEGGLSVDGRLRPPKFGLLDYMLKTFEPDGERDLVFVPVGINYDRVLEDRTLLARCEPAQPPRGKLFALGNTIRFIARNLRLLAVGRWYRFGYACVNFGRPLSMRDYVKRHALNFPGLDDGARRHEVERVAQALMAEVAGIVPVLPVSLAATVFAATNGRALSELELKSAVQALVARLDAAGVRIYVPRANLDYAISVGLRMLSLRRIVEKRDGLYRAVPGERMLLEYYANAIAPLVARSRALNGIAA